MGASIVLAAPFLWVNRWVSLAAGVLVIIAGNVVGKLVVTYPWLIWLGVKQAGVYMVDYYPILPWYGIALLGDFCRVHLLPGGRPPFYAA
ncbi:MAG: DUF1624 domain-containing protein [Anaerolineales bacterium]|nr:DUF1624 domain-containing protein [Anaerolineales bacterium]